MRKRIQWAVAVVLVLASPALYALGLGSAKVNSYLNQPLDVKVELISQNSDELQSITTGLASARDFELLGLKLNAISVPLEFEVISEGEKPFIHITSRLNVNDPVMQVLLEVVWANGRMLREYTLFLDPPTLSSKAPAPVVTTVPAPVPAPAPEVTSPAAAAPVAAPAKTIVPPKQLVTPATAEQEADSPESTPASISNSGDQQQRQAGNSATVAKGQTLWGIASDWSKGTGYSVNQTMLAIQRKNPGAFIDDNINRLKQGEILRMPATNEMADISSQQAALEVLRQAAEINPTLGTPDYDTPTLADSGYQDLTAMDALVEDVESDEGRLELVPPSDGADDAVGAISQASDEVTADDVNEQVMQEKLSRTEEDLINAELENNYLKDRIAELEQAAEEAGNLQVQDADLANMANTLADKLATDEPEPAIALTPGGENEPWYAGATIWILAAILFVILLIIWFLRRRSLQQSANQQELENQATVQAVAEEAEDLLDILDNYGAGASGRSKSSYAEEQAVEVDSDIELNKKPDLDKESETKTRITPVLVADTAGSQAESDRNKEQVAEEEPAIRLPDESLLDEQEVDDIEEIGFLDESAGTSEAYDEEEKSADDSDESNDPELKLDLARAYLSLGDKEAAKSMLDEVMNSGNDDQKDEARQMLDEL
jgi:pilus assembly protein FimV